MNVLTISSHLLLSSSVHFLSSRIEASTSAWLARQKARYFFSKSATRSTGTSCVAFNNHAGSTKSYDYVREHNESVSLLDFVPSKKEITTKYKSGQRTNVKLHNGAYISLQKIDKNYDPSNKNIVLDKINKSEDQGNILTGLLYINENAKDHTNILNLADTPLNSMSEKELLPKNVNLKSVNASHR